MREKNNISIRFLIQTAMVVLVCSTIIFVVHSITKKEEPKLTNTFINEKLETASKLTTAQLTYNGLVEYSEGNIPFINKKAFNMIYRADVDAGVDLSKVEVNITDSKVELKCPKAEVFDVVVDTDSIKFYDEKFALFNGEKREDTVNAIKEAKKDVLEKQNINELKLKAEEQTKIILTGFLEDFMGERTLEISYK